MEQTAKKSNKKLIILLSAILIVVVCGFAALWVFFGPKATAGKKEIHVEVVYEDKTTDTYEIKTSSDNLRSALEEKDLIKGTESDYGLMVETVNGVTVDQAKQQWWAITKSGEMLATGVDATMIQDGDSYELTFTTGW